MLAQPSAEIMLTNGVASIGRPRLFDRLIFIALLSVVALTAIPYGTVEPWWVAVFECAVFGLAIFAIIEAFISKTLRIDGLALAAPLILLVLFVLFQSLSFLSARDAAGVISMDQSWSADPYGSRLFAIKLFSLVVTGLLLTRYVFSTARLRALVFLVIGIGLATAIFGLLRKNLQTGPTFFHYHLIIDDNTFGQFVNKNHFAFLLEMTLGLSLGLLTGLKDRRKVFTLLPIAALVWVALVISRSRGGMLGSLGEVLFLVVMLDPVGRLMRKFAGDERQRLRAVTSGFILRGLLFVCFIVAFGYGVAWIGGEPVVNSFQSATNDFGHSGALNNANTSRRQMWSITWQAFKDHPVVGLGFGAYWIGITKYHQASGELTPQQAHNDYLDLLAAGGLIGCALVIWFGVVFLRTARESLRAPDPFRRAVCIGALTGIFGVAMHSFLDFGLHITINAVIFIALIVIASVRISPQNSQTPVLQ
jgi:O-antigen ligase